MTTAIFSLFAIIVVLSGSVCHGLDHSEEGKRDKRSDDLGPLETVVTQLSQEVTSLRAQLEAERNNKGSTFIRWGSSTCPATSSTVYSGVAGGAGYQDEGGSSLPLCLSLQPQLDATTHHATAYNIIYGVEYEVIANKQDYEMPCAVCEAAQTRTMMVPGTKTCPPGWTVQYWGHLTGNNVVNHGAFDFTCIDNSPEGRGSSANENGALVYYTVARCGSLPCPPYENGRVLTCVVCSK